MLENTIEQTDLITPADAIELSMNELEEVNGAFGGGGSCWGGGSCFGSCFTAFNFTVDFHQCLQFVTFGGGSCWGSSCFSSCFN